MSLRHGCCGLAWGRGCRQRIDLEGEAVDLADYYELSGGQRGGRDGVPEFAVDEDFALRRECGLCDSGFAHQALGSGYYFIAPRFEGDGHQESGDQAERNAHCQRGQQVDAHFGDRRIDQKQASQGEKRDPADGEHSVGGELRFGGEESEGSENQSQRRKTRRQKIKRESREQNENYADGSWNHRAGVIEFDVECERADGENQERDVRVHESVQDVFLERHFERNNGLACKVQ